MCEPRDQVANGDPFDVISVEQLRSKGKTSFGAFRFGSCCNDFNHYGLRAVGGIDCNRKTLIVSACRKLDGCWAFFRQLNFFFAIKEMHQVRFVDLKRELPFRRIIDPKSDDTPSIRTSTHYRR